MKTTIYLRLSLLIPFVVWVIGLLVLMIMSKAPISEVAVSASTTIAGLLFVFLAFYVIGILIWIFPYMLLALILFLSSFINRAQVTMRVFVFSPIAMAILTLATLNLLALGPAGGSTFFSSATEIQDYTDFNLFVAIISLLWGYICVGIGFGVYKILQRLDTIKDVEIEVAPVMTAS